MADVQLSGAARTDLAEIRTYSLVQFDADTADRYFLGFEAAFDLLAEHPHAGRKAPEFGAGICCLVHHRHRIFYHVVDGDVLILRIIHHARNARREMRSRT